MEKLVTITPGCKGPHESFGIAPERFQYFKEVIPTWVNMYAFEGTLTIDELMQKVQNIAQDNQELAYVNFSVGAGISTAHDLKMKEKILAALKAGVAAEKGTNAEPKGGVMIIGAGEVGVKKVINADPYRGAAILKPGEA